MSLWWKSCDSNTCVTYVTLSWSSVHNLWRKSTTNNFFCSNLLTTHKCPGCYVVPSALTPLSKYMYMCTSIETPLDLTLIPKIKICLKAIGKENWGLNIFVMPTNSDLYSKHVVPNSFPVWHGVLFIRQGLYQEGIFRFILTIPENFPDGDCPVSKL